MPKANANKVFSSLPKGLITEAGPLSFPMDATTDELNCDLFTEGTRRRRLGFNLEDSYSLSSVSVNLLDWRKFAIKTFSWKAVGGDGNLSFLVLQVGATLYFYDDKTDPISSGQKSFTISLDAFGVIGASTIARDVVQAVSGRGHLFVVSPWIEPFYVIYDPILDTISTTAITIKIRDFVGLDDGLDPDEEPTTLSDSHSYNLKNQGWLSPGGSVADPVTTYFSAISKYPPNSKQWWQGKDSSEDFSAALMTKFNAGNTEATKGHYILDAFSKDRTAASGVANLVTVTTEKRPTAIAFFAGRVWYAGVEGDDQGGNLWFSQILEDVTSAGKCYQLNDPTSEDLNSLLATDGGELKIPESATIIALFVTRSSLLIFASNGIWAITGGAEGAGFKATDYQVNKISSIDILGRESLVDVEGVPVWWSSTGIMTLKQNDVSLSFGVVNLTKDTVQSFYDDIPTLSKVDTNGVYDSASKKIYWLYRETEAASAVNKYRFDRVLILDTRLQAFLPWKLSALSTNPFYLCNVFTTSSLNSITSSAEVADSEVLVVDGGIQVVAQGTVVTGTDTFLGFMCFRETATTVQWTFGNFSSTSFHDWEVVDAVGVNYDSYFESGDELAQDVQRNKQSIYIHAFFNRTETAYTDTNYDTYVNPSGCLMQTKWEWSDHSNSHKFTPLAQVYKFRRAYTPASGLDFNNGFPVVSSRNRVRGIGRAIRVRFESQDGKDFHFLGWAISMTGNTEE